MGYLKAAVNVGQGALQHTMAIGKAIGGAVAQKKANKLGQQNYEEKSDWLNEEMSKDMMLSQSNQAARAEAAKAIQERNQTNMAANAIGGTTGEMALAQQQQAYQGYDSMLANMASNSETYKQGLGKELMQNRYDFIENRQKIQQDKATNLNQSAMNDLTEGAKSIGKGVGEAAATYFGGGGKIKKNPNEDEEQQT